MNEPFQQPLSLHWQFGLATQHATSNCKPLMFRFPCKRQYIHVGTFKLFVTFLVMSLGTSVKLLYVELG